MNRHWLTSYGERITAEINPDAYGSVLEMLESAMTRYAGRRTIDGLVLAYWSGASIRPDFSRVVIAIIVRLRGR